MFKKKKKKKRNCVVFFFFFLLKEKSGALKPTFLFDKKAKFIKGRGLGEEGGKNENSREYEWYERKNRRFGKKKKNPS